MHNDNLFVQTPQSTLNPKTEPFLAGVQGKNFFDDATSFVSDDLIDPVLGGAVGIVDSSVGAINPLLGSVDGIVDTLTGTIDSTIGGVTDAAGDLFGSPFLLIGGAIAIVIIIAVVAK